MFNKILLKIWVKNIHIEKLGLKNCVKNLRLKKLFKKILG